MPPRDVCALRVTGAEIICLSSRKVVLYDRNVLVSSGMKSLKLRIECLAAAENGLAAMLGGRTEDNVSGVRKLEVDKFSLHPVRVTSELCY